MGAALAVAAVAGTGLPELGLSTDYRVFFSEDNPDLRAYERIEEVYTRNDPVRFVVKPRAGDIFTERTLEALRALTDDAWQIPHSTRVDAVTNHQHTWAEGDDLVVEDLVPAGPITPSTLRRARDVGLSEPLLRGRLVAANGRAPGVAVRIELPGESTAELPEAVEGGPSAVAEAGHSSRPGAAGSQHRVPQARNDPLRSRRGRAHPAAFTGLARSWLPG